MNFFSSLRGNLIFLHFAFSLVLTGLVLLIFYYAGINNQPISIFYIVVAVFIYILILLMMAYFVKVWFDKKLQVEKNNTLEIINRFEAINIATNDAIWDHDLVTGETFYNNRLLNIFGYSKTDLKNNESWWFDNIHPDDRERVKSRIDEKLKDIDALWQDEYQFKCKDGTYKIVKDRSYIVRDMTGKPLRLIGAMNDLTKERALQQAIVQEKLEHKNELGKAIILAHETERKNLREELHEDVNQILASVKLCIHQISTQVAPNDLINSSISQLDEVIFKIRHISNQLSPSGLDYLGLIAAIKDVIVFKESIYPVRIGFKYDQFKENVIDKSIEIFLYRIFVDLINNMFFTAGEKPAEIEIEIKNSGNKIHISITDNCQAVLLDEIIMQRHITGIGNRLEIYDGKIEVAINKDKTITTSVYL
jgi:two-component system, NarL family, sensor histidine kinase UhpB